MDTVTPLGERMNTIMCNKINTKKLKIQIYSKEQYINKVNKNENYCPSIKTIHRKAKRQGSQNKYSTINVRPETKRKINFTNLGENR